MLRKIEIWMLREFSKNNASARWVFPFEVTKDQIRSLVFTALIGLILLACSGDEKAPVIKEVTISSISPPSPATMLIGEKITVSFSYNTNIQKGVRIFIRPMNGSELVDDYSASPSTLYTGSGTGTADFTITLGNDVHVDRLRIQVWNDDETELLDEQFETVDYHFVSTLVEITEISPSNITTLLMGEKITVNFKFKTVVTSGLHILVRPITAGALSPNYVAEPSPNYIAPTGTSMGDFTINQLEALHVDQVRIQAFNTDSNELLYENFVTVDYNYLSAMASITTFNNTTSGEFCAKEHVSFAFNYKTSIPEGVYIFITPITGEKTSTKSAYKGSPLYTTLSGNGNSYFTIITNDTTHVDHARIRVYNSSQTTLLYEELFPVDYTFIGSRAKITTLEPASPKSSPLNTNINITFEYRICESAGARIHIRPFTGNALTPFYAGSGSPIFTGSGSASANFTITAGTNVKVDKLRIQVFSPDYSVLLYEYFENVSYTFNGS